MSSEVEQQASGAAVPVAPAADAASQEPVKERKHPLEHRWTFYFKGPQNKTQQFSWSDQLTPVYSFNTVEDFWCLYNNILAPSKLSSHSDIFLFKENVKPEWEDPVNEQGGAWIVTTGTKTPTSNYKAQIDKWWLNILLAVIGEQFDEGNEVCGICLNIRKQIDKLQLWTKTASNEAAQYSIGKQLKQFLDLQESIGFVTHSDKKTEVKSSHISDKYTV